MSTRVAFDLMQGDAGTLIDADGYAAALGARIVPDEDDVVIVEMTVAEAHLNFLGGVHGGVVFSLADIALSLAANRGSEPAYAVETQISFVRGARSGDTLRARAERETATRSMEWYRIPVTAGDGQTVALFRGMVYRPRSH